MLLLGCTPAPTPPPEPGPETVEVGHTRELRGLWVATVANIDYPSRPGLSTAAQRQELADLVELAETLRFNAIFFQVRSIADAMYASELEPWSRALTGKEGTHPGWDPLETLIADAHQRGIQVHAWLNPLRASTTRSGHADSHVSQTHAHWTVPHGDLLWLDPGLPGPVDRLEEVVTDLVARYDLDGVHFDDYFYPYPVKGAHFDDDASYAAFAAPTTERSDWRRSNVDRMVARISAAVRAGRDHVHFGISPFGIYRPGIPEGIRGMDQVEAIHADPLAWLDAVDYLAPQLYWPTTRKHQAFATLADWWSDQARADTAVFTGLYLSALGTADDWTVDELSTQVELARAAPGLTGQIWFSARPLLDDRDGIRAVLSDDIYARPALPPPLARAPDEQPEPPILEHGHRGLQIRPGARSYTLYRDTPSDGWQLEAVLGKNPRPLRLEPGRWAIAAVGPHGRESAAALFVQEAPVSRPSPRPRPPR